MKPSLRTKLDQLSSRLAELDGLLGSPDVTSDLDRYRALTKEHSDLGPVVARFRDSRARRRTCAPPTSSPPIPSMREFADEERAAAQARIAALEIELQAALLPKDPNDERNVFLEIRAGTGGDESALFAGNLLRMYVRYAERHRWQPRDRLGVAVGARRLQGSDRAHRRARARTRSSSSSRAAIACSACRRPRRRAASTRRRARSP